MFEQTFKNIDDVLWKEAGCTTELDYTEQTSWLLFLKYLDGLEQDRADEAALNGRKYTYILDKPYRWESWAAPKGKDGTLDHNKALTGDDLRDFVNQKLFPYLHGFTQKATGPNTIEYKGRADLRGDQEQDFERLQPARDHRSHRRAALPIADREARAVAPLRSQDPEHGQRRAQRRRVLHAASAHPRHGAGRGAQDRRADLRRRVRIGRLPLRVVRLSESQGQAHDQGPDDAPDAYVLREGKEVARLRHRDHEHDPAWHRGAEHPAPGHEPPPAGPPEPPGPGLDPGPGRRRIKVKLADGKERCIQHMMATTFWYPDGTPMSAQQFMEPLFGKLPEFFKDEAELRTLWSTPDTRKKLLQGLAEKGFGGEQLAEMQKMIDAEKSDLFDVLAHVAYALPPITREERAAKARVEISTHFNSKQQVFLDFVLSHYVSVGVEELDQEKLTPLLQLKYHNSIADALADLGKPEEIGRVFAGFQKYLYQQQVAA